MRTLSVFVLVIAASLAACKKKEDSAAAPAAGSAAATSAGSGSAEGSGSAAAAAAPAAPASCQDAGKNYAKVLAADPSTELGKAAPGQQTLMKYSYEEACEQDWTEAEKSCAAAASSTAAARACFGTEKLAALDAMTTAELADMAKNKAANEAAAAAAAAGSGSASGSAAAAAGGSGSATP